MKTRTALVLSGGGLFGAWQAGAWRALSERWKPDLIVGASAGALNGYAIAAGATPGQLQAMWLRPEFAVFRKLPETIRDLIDGHPPVTDFALVLTDLLRMKPRVFGGPEITWEHLAASCAIPLLFPQYK